MDKPASPSRKRILRAALRHFAERGYAGASVQAIVDEAGVTKPTLYYYFQSKAGLFQALLDWAHDERYQLMRAAARHALTLEGQLTEILAALFEFINDHRSLMRLAFATAFAARGEIPPGIQYLEKSERNFAFIHALIRKAHAQGELDRKFSTRELTMGIYGLMTIKVMEHLVKGRPRLTRRTAESIVHLYLNGAMRPGAGERKTSRLSNARSRPRPLFRSSKRKNAKKTRTPALASNGHGFSLPNYTA